MLRGRNEWVRWEKWTTRSLGEKILVVVSVLHLVISTRGRKPQRAVWSGLRSDIARCWEGLGSAEPGSRLTRAHFGMWGCQQPPVHHTRVTYPLWEPTRGSLCGLSRTFTWLLLFLEGRTAPHGVYLGCGWLPTSWAPCYHQFGWRNHCVERGPPAGSWLPHQVGGCPSQRETLNDKGRWADAMLASPQVTIIGD